MTTPAKAKKQMKLAFIELKKFRATGESHYMLQASEKGWKAVTEYLFYKSKKKTTKHRLMAEEAKKADIEAIFKVGEKLHANFYHDFMDSYEVEQDLIFIKKRMVG